MNRLILLLLLLPCSPFGAYAQSPSADSAWLITHYTKKEVYIPMRDGIRLFTAIYAPKAAGRHPFLVCRTPYSVGPYGEHAFKGFWKSYYMYYFKQNYIMVLQDVRGRYMSEGQFEDVRPYNPLVHHGRAGKPNPNTLTDEASDTYDAVDWLVKHVKNNNKKVGVFGISYPGFYATMAALSGHPDIKAVSPQAPVTEWFLGDDFHHNGAFMAMDAFSFYSGFGKARPFPTTKGSSGYQCYTKDNYKFYLGMGAIKNLAIALNDSVAFWNDIYAHPNYDSWWQNRNTRKWVQHIPRHIATLEVGGLFDAEDGYGTWNLYKAIERKADNNNRLVMGPWRHGGWARDNGDYLGNVRFGTGNSQWYRQNIEEPFFDHYLLDKKIKPISEATIFFSGENKWHTFNQWPPKDEQPRSMYLHGDGSLSWATPPGNNNIYKEYVSDPAKPVPYTDGVQTHRTVEYMTDDQRFAATRPDVLVYQTDSLDQDVKLAGPLIADLFVSLSITDADFVVKLIDVFPDNFTYNDSIDGKGNGKNYPTMGGYEMLVRGEIMRGRYRNSFENPEAFVPGKITEVKYTLPDVAHVFKKGHRIMVQVQSSWFPLADRNPQQFVNIYTCDNKDFIPCDIKLFSGKGYASRIILPEVR